MKLSTGDPKLLTKLRTYPIHRCGESENVLVKEPDLGYTPVVTALARAEQFYTTLSGGVLEESRARGEVYQNMYMETMAHSAGTSSPLSLSQSPNLCHGILDGLLDLLACPSCGPFNRAGISPRAVRWVP